MAVNVWQDSQGSSSGTEAKVLNRFKFHAKVPHNHELIAIVRLLRAGDLIRAKALVLRSLGLLPAAGESGASTQTGDRLPTIFEELPMSGAPLVPQPATERRPSVFLSLSFANAAGSRAYKLYVPSSYDGTPCALIVMLHGCLQSASDFAAGTRMNELAERFAFVVAYPEQPASANSSRCWNWFNRADQQRDRGEPSLVAGLTQHIIAAYAIDPHRVYVAGMSAGGAAAAVLGATYPDVYAAVGVHSGLMCGAAHDVPSAFAAMRGNGSVRRVSLDNGEAPQIPTIVFHGDRDATVHPRNADRFAAQIPADWKRQTQTGQSPGGRAYSHTTYRDHNGDDALEQWVIHGADHAWSGGSASGSYTDPKGPDASAEMVRFFFSHSLASGLKRTVA
jgi:poly(hydroxyalkanoate) depolymerase family esterase